MEYAANAQGSDKMYGGALGAQKAAPRDPEFQIALKKLSGINGRLNELSAIAGTAAEKIVGPMPVPLGSGENKGAAPLPNNYLAELLQSLEHTSEVLERTYRSVTRITNEF